MKQMAAALKVILLIAILASLAACKGGTFTDPGHEGTSIGGGGGGGKPARLSSNAGYREALAKLDEIIDYCENHPGQVNDAVKVNARQSREMLSRYGVEDSWSSIKGTMIDSINFCIESLQ